MAKKWNQKQKKRLRQGIKKIEDENKATKKSKKQQKRRGKT